MIKWIMSVHCVMTKKHINVIYFELCKKKKITLVFEVKKKKRVEPEGRVSPSTT